MKFYDLIHTMFLLCFLILGHTISATAGEKDMAMTLASTAFKQQSEIPSVYTCRGAYISPPLKWDSIPDDTQSLVLIVDDPDAPDPKAPKLTWVHWLLYNIPPSVNALPEKVDSQNLASGILEGKNDWQITGYRGPCPPIGRHRYFFKLYALDKLMPDLQLPNKSQLENAMKGHILEYAELIGTYKK